MKAAIMAGTYPRSYSVLPICHYVERNMDSDEMYDSIKMLDKWYADNYRNKSEAVLRREAIKNYLLSENNLSERRADMTISKLAKHKDIYLDDGISISSGCSPSSCLRHLPTFHLSTTFSVQKYEASHFWISDSLPFPLFPVRSVSL